MRAEVLGGVESLECGQSRPDKNAGLFFRPSGQVFRGGTGQSNIQTRTNRTIPTTKARIMSTGGSTWPDVNSLNADNQDRTKKPDKMAIGHSGRIIWTGGEIVADRSAKANTRPHRRSQVHPPSKTVE